MALPIPGGDPNQQSQSSSGAGGKPQQSQPQNQPNGQENPQKQPQPQDNPGGDPAQDMYQAQYRHRLLEALRAAGGEGRPWGNLPDRVREELASGAQEEFVPEYEGLTREYYKRVQEESQKRKR